MSKEEPGAKTALATAADTQLHNAKKLNQTWKFDGTTYPLFVANKTGNIGSPIMHPSTNRQIAVLGADFAWEDSQPFLDHLNLKIRDERSSREDESVRKRANITRLNSGLFDELVQSGSMIKIDEFGDQSEPVEKTRDEMLAYQQEVKSQLIDDWLGNFSVERYFPAGTDEVDAMLTNTETVFFVVKIGNFKNPAHVLLMEFAAPSPDARRSFEDDTMFLSTKRDGDQMVETYNIKQNAKLNFGKKYFVSVDGVVIGPGGNFEPDTNDLKPVDKNDSGSVEFFKASFNPHWWIRLANELADSFNFRGK